jgi:hypothetical protein
MSERATFDVLLEAIGKFLDEEVRPAVPAERDPRLHFRLLIAAHLAGTMAAEVRVEEEQDAAAMGRLRELLPDVTLGPWAEPRAQSAAIDDYEPQPMTRAERRQELALLERELASRIREGRIVDLTRVREVLMAGLRERLAIVSPRFDVRIDVD